MREGSGLANESIKDNPEAQDLALRLATNRLDLSPIDFARLQARIVKALEGLEQLDVDLEIGGNDQLFNMMVGRTLMKSIKNKEKYIDNPKAWAESESTLKKILDKLGMKYKEAENEAAFYGPKLDVQMRNVWGKEDTMFTVQIDFSNPEKFDLTYADKDNKQSRPMIIHRASIGCYERTLAMLIEKYAGNFPTWLSPVQVKLLTITRNQEEYAKQTAKALADANIRVAMDLSDEKIGAKIRNARHERVSYILVVGEKEVTENKVAVRRRGAEDLGPMDFVKFQEMISEEIKNKKLP